MELHKNSNAPYIFKLYPRQLNNIILSKSKRGQTPMLISHTMQEPLKKIIFLVITLCKFWHLKLVVKISQNLLQHVASNLVS